MDRSTPIALENVDLIFEVTIHQLHLSVLTLNGTLLLISLKAELFETKPAEIVFSDRP